MATSKAKAKTATKPAAKGKNKWAAVQLPEGFKPITQGDFGQEWDYEKNPLIVGTVVGDTREVEGGKGKDKWVKRVITVDSEAGDGLFDVWETASLAPFFDMVEDGQRVSVAFQGYRDTGKPSAMKVFVGGIEGDEAGDPPTMGRKSKPAKRGRR